MNVSTDARRKGAGDDVLRGQLVVRVVAEGGDEAKVFDFSTFPLTLELQALFARGFARSTGPSGSRRTITSAGTAFRDLKRVAVLLGGLEDAPQSIAGLRPGHVDVAYLRFARTWLSVRGTLKGVLQKQPGVPGPFMQRLLAPVQKAPAADPLLSYSPEHLRLVLRAAREKVLVAYRRITDAKLRVAAFEQGDPDQDDVTRSECAYQLHILRTGDVKRKAANHPTRRGLAPGARSPGALLRDFHLNVDEAGALAVLLVGLTGENLAQILTLPAAHVRADSQVNGTTPVALTRASKPRRGATGSQMTIPLTGVPTWILGDASHTTNVSDGAGVDLFSAFGAFVAAQEMCSLARAFSGSDRLLVSYGSNRKQPYRHVTQADLNAWYVKLDIRDRQGQRVAINTRRLRLTFIEHKQKPVAQSPRTFLDTYLLKNRGNIAEYQSVVARVLDAEVARARESVARVITADTVALASSDPARAAGQAGTDLRTLHRVLEGELDTVMTSCIDNDNSPYTVPGSPCGASFMLCLGCPNARAEPRHLPVQLLVFKTIEARRSEMEGIEWADRFAVHHARLQNLFSQFPTATLDAARDAETDDDVALVARFLGRELDRK